MLPISTSKWLSAGLMACAAAFATPAIAGPVVYDNGAPNQLGGNNMSFAVQAEDFILTANTTISDVHFWSLETNGAYRGGFFWGLYSNVGGSPGAAISSGFQTTVSRTVTGGGAFGDFEILNEFDVTPTALTAGSTYWLVLHNGAFGNRTDDGLDFLWETTALAGRLGGQEDLSDGFGFQGNGVEHAFQLTGPNAVSVPEPMTGGLVAAALAALMLTRQRARRRN